MKVVLYWLLGFITTSIFVILCHLLLKSSISTNDDALISSNQISLLLNEIQPPISTSGMDTKFLNTKVTPTATLINKLELIRPNDTQSCVNGNPWSIGEKMIEQDEFLSADDCFAIRFNLQAPAKIILITNSTIGNALITFPKQCNFNKQNNLYPAGEDIFVPILNDGTRSAFRINNQSEEDWVYLLAYTNMFDQLNLMSKLTSLANVCKITEGVYSNFDFRKILTEVRENNQTSFDWQSFRFYH